MVQTSMLLSLFLFHLSDFFSPFCRVDNQLNCVKGGGACHLREKVIAEAANTFACFFTFCLIFFSLAKSISKASSLLQIIEKTSSILAPMYFISIEMLQLWNNFSFPRAPSRGTYRGRTICLCQGASGFAQ